MQTPIAADAGSGAPLVPSVADDKVLKWEYEILEDLGSDPKAKLNELGNDGWMLITAKPYVFRRPKPPEEAKTRGPVGFARK
jgi:hypothetical protein